MESETHTTGTLDGFFVLKSKGVWYSRTDILEFVIPFDLNTLIASRKLTAAHRIAVDHHDGAWQKGGSTTAYCDKLIRTSFPHLPYRRPCLSCAAVKPLADFCPSATTPTFTQLRPECRACGNAAKAGTESKARAALTCTHKTCDTCGVVKAVASFSGARKTCSSCRDSQAKERNVVKAAVDPTLRICTGCKVAKTADKFADSEIKTCLACAAKNARHDAQPARREYHRLLNKEMQYWVGSRERERAKDEAGYLARNAATQRANINNKLYDTKYHAKERTIPWELTDDQALDLIQASCIYSGQESVPGSFGGIDRLDSALGYTVDNCVPARGWANKMKASLDVVTFLQRAEHIAAVATGDPKFNLYPDAWEDRTPNTFKGHRNNAIKEGHTWGLSEDEFYAIQKRDCTLCLRRGPSSVDRVDNVNHYSVATTQPLCVECNLFKNAEEDAIFIQRCIHIANHGALALFQDEPIERQRKSIKRRNF